MKKLIFIGLLILQNFTSFAQETSIENDINIDEFINIFYQTQNNPKEMIPFFDKTYYDTFYKFIEHMDLKNKKCGMFVEKKLKSKRISPNGNIISLRYKVKYKKCSRNDKIVLKRNLVTNYYRIYYWRTR